MNHTREQITQCCKKLRLRRMTDNLDLVDESDPEVFLLKLLEMEIIHREHSRVSRLIRSANFYSLKTFETYRFDEIKFPSSVTSESLKDLEFIDNKQNLILYGNVGTGKTHLTTAIGVQACTRGMTVAFYRTAALVNKLTRLSDEGKIDSFLKSLDKLDLLICDEWGYVPVNRDGAQLLFQVVSACYEKRSMVITTNLEFSRWVNIFLDEAMTTAIIDRLVHYSHLILFDGESYRVRNSLIR